MTDVAPKTDFYLKLAAATIIAEDGVEISRTSHRHVLTPDADLTAEDGGLDALIAFVEASLRKSSNYVSPPWAPLEDLPE